MSLQDIMFKRAAQQFQNEFGSGRLLAEGLSQGVETLAAGVAARIQKQKDEAEAKRKEEEVFQERIKFEEQEKAAGREISRTFGKGGGISVISKTPSGTSIKPSTTRIEAGKILGTIPDTDAEAVKIIKRAKDKESIIPEGFEQVGFFASGKPKFEKKVPGIDQLTSIQQIQAHELADNIRHKKASEVLPAIVQGLNEGKTIDTIEDEIRFGKQSAQFSGPLRSASENIMITSGGKVTQQMMDFVDDDLQNGRIGAAKDKLKRAARASEKSVKRNEIQGKERTVELLEEIREDLASLENAGFDTNIFSGTEEEINAKIGKVKNAQARQVAEKIHIAIINYRKAMSGAQFSVPESKDYVKVFPSISKTSEFNTANINALVDVFGGDLDSFYSLSMGTENYNKLFKQPKVQTATNPTTGERIESIDGGKTWQPIQ